MADSVHALTVEAWLVRCDHARKKRLGIVLVAYALRAFVDAEIVADSVARAVAEIALGAPERHTGKGIDLAAGRSLREDGHGQIDHTLENEGVILFLKRCAWAHRHCPRDVGRTGKVLAA